MNFMTSVDVVINPFWARSTSKELDEFAAVDQARKNKNDNTTEVKNALCIDHGFLSGRKGAMAEPAVMIQIRNRFLENGKEAKVIAYGESYAVNKYCREVKNGGGITSNGTHVFGMANVRVLELKEYGANGSYKIMKALLEENEKDSESRILLNELSRVAENKYEWFKYIYKEFPKRLNVW